jgi:hypothetical protein
MATTKQGQTIKMTTTGVVKKGRIKVQSIDFVNTTANHTATFSTYSSGPDSAEKDATVRAVIASVATGVVTATGYFTATNVDTGDVIEVDYGSDKNQGVAFLATRDSDDQVTASPVGDLTDETTSVWVFSSYTPVQEFVITADASTGVNPVTFYPDGRWFSNLTLTQLSAGTIYVHYE